jgi:cyclophilin family peptidyl-prolyl cis-trans isomerase
VTEVLSGVAFIDANGNGLFNQNEAVLPGIPVSISGTTYLGTNLSAATTSDANGAFQFLKVPRGTYQIQFGALTGFLDAPLGNPGLSAFGVDGSSTLQQNVVFGGLAADFISLRQFLSSTTSDNFPGMSPAGTGLAPVTGPVKTTIADVSLGTSSKTLDLANNFTAPDIITTLVRLETNEGPINVQLFDTHTPLTVANFFNYINSNRFDNTIFHRLVSNFVLQGGGFQYQENPSTLNAVTTDPSVLNEFGISNTTGTVAMAKVGNDPNSATSQFFFNLADNSANLDVQNGGFTVFGKIVGAADQEVVDTLADYSIKDESGGDPNSPFGSIPLQGYSGTNFPTDTTAGNYALLQDVVTVSRNQEVLTYSLQANSDPNQAILKASITNNRLSLVPVAKGTVNLTVRATDLYGSFVDSTFQVTVANQPPSATVTLNTSSPLPTDTLTATATTSDPEGNPVTLTYAWQVGGNTVAETSNTLNLGNIANVTPGSLVRVQVTPNDGTSNGAIASALATVNQVPVVSPVVLTPSNPGTTDTLTATVTSASDPEGSPVTLIYVWKVNGSTVKTTPGTTSFSDSLDLTTLGNLTAGDQVSVEVTPNDGRVDGPASTATVTIV